MVGLLAHLEKHTGVSMAASSGNLCSFAKRLQKCRADPKSPSGVEDDDFLCFLDTHFELTRFKATDADFGVEGSGRDTCLPDLLYRYFVMLSWLGRSSCSVRLPSCAEVMGPVLQGGSEEDHGTLRQVAGVGRTGPVIQFYHVRCRSGLGCPARIDPRPRDPSKDKP